MKLIGRLLHGLVGRSRQADRILAQLGSGQVEDATLLASQAGRMSPAEWQAIGEAAARLGPEAEVLLFLALRATGTCYPLLISCGHWLARHGETLRAFVFFTAAHRLAPGESAPLLSQAEIQLALGNFQAAATKFMAALQRDETSDRARKGLSEARLQAGLAAFPTDTPQDLLHHEEGLHRALELTPDDYRSHLAYGRLLVKSNRSAEALPVLETAHRLSGGATETGIQLTAALTMLHRHEEAHAIASAALVQSPDDPELIALTAECAAMTNRDVQAIELYRRFVEMNPQADANIWSNLGNCLARLESFEEALTPLDRAVSSAPTNISARLNLSYALYFAGRRQQAENHLDALLAIEQNDFETRWLRASLLLANHRFSEGWRDYEFRSVQSNTPLQIQPFPLWCGQPLSGKKIIVTAEQGIGDQIMFASCLGELLSQTDRVVVECEPRLAGLFCRSFPQTEVVCAPLDKASHDDADFHIPLGSLPGLLRKTLESFNRTKFPFLNPAPDLVSRFKARLDGFGPGLKVGVAWRGGVASTRTLSRSLQLSQLSPLLKLPGCHFISLQYGNCNDEVGACRDSLGISLHHWPETLSDLEAFAALTAALDLVVTVCSAPVHFAGALGKPALVLAPHVPEWRYAGIDYRMLWYPSVSLLAQPVPGDWIPVIEEASHRLIMIAGASIPQPDVTN